MLYYINDVIHVYLGLECFSAFYEKLYLHTGEKVVVHKHEGHIQSRIVYYLMNIHITPRTIYLSRVSGFDSISLITLYIALFNITTYVNNM